MIITSLNGQSELLTDYQIKERKRVVNGEYSLPFFVVRTDQNSHSFPLAQEEAVIEYDGQKYRIKKLREYVKGNTPVKEITQCSHVFFDIIDDYQYDTLSGTLNMTQVLNHVFSVTDWTWVNHGAFASVEFDDFGDGNALELFRIILERYGAEFEITGEREITIKNQIGAPRDAQFRYRHNIKTIYKDVDSSNVSTYVKGFGKDITAEYTSPNAAVYGIRHAPPVRDERFTVQANLLEHLQAVLIDTPNIVIEIEVSELKKQGIPIHEYGLGDTIYLIHEGLGIDATVRILEYTDYPESGKSPTVVLSNYKKSLSKVMTAFQQTSKTLRQLTDADGNLSLSLKRLYRNSDHFSDHTGDWYISPDDPNAYVHIGAGGLDVHKGLIRVEREDGYATVIGGVIQNDFAIVGATPAFTAANVSVEGYFWSTTSTTATDCQYYTFLHNARYLKVWVALYAGDAGSGSRISVQDGNTTLAAKVTYNTDPNSDLAVVGEVLTVDLGVPTGNFKSIYVRLNTGSAGDYKAYGRVIRMWKEG